MLRAGVELIVRDAAVTEHDEPDWRDWTCECYRRTRRGREGSRANLRAAFAPVRLDATRGMVRKRLDFEKSVDCGGVEEYLEIACPAPNGGNMNSCRWLAIQDGPKIEEPARLDDRALAASARDPLHRERARIEVAWPDIRFRCSISDRGETAPEGTEGPRWA